MTIESSYKNVLFVNRSDTRDIVLPVEEQFVQGLLLFNQFGHYRLSHPSMFFTSGYCIRTQWP